MPRPNTARSFGTVCCVPSCKNNTKFNHNVSWHGFPKDLTLRKEWIRRCHRSGSNGKFSKWCPTIHSKICGAHFNETGRKKYEDKLPTIFPHKLYEHKYLTGKKAFAPVVIAEDVRNRSIYPMQFDDTSPSFLCQPYDLEEVDDTLPFTKEAFEVGANVEVPEPKEKQNLRRTNASNLLATVHGCILKDPKSITESVPTSTRAAQHMQCHNYAFHSGKRSLYIMKQNLDEAIDSNLMLEAENRTLKKEVMQLKKELSTLQKKQKHIQAELSIEKSKTPEAKEFSLKYIIDDEEKIRFYTGFENKVRLDIFLDFIVNGYNTNVKKTNPCVGRPKVLDIRDEIFIVLCRLRLGLLEADLAYRFQVSVSTINKIWHYWLNFISSYLVQLPIWPSRLTVQQFMPEEFKRSYPTTRIVLDCTELFIENPSEFRVQSDTYSSYKSHNTAKGLIGITPNGFVSLVSDLAPGRLSDKVITNNSGLYAKLEPGDSVMADRGFLIEERLREIGVGLNIPPFLKGRPQLSIEDEQVTREIAKLRIHVERVIRGVKQFRILKYVFPNSMADKLDPIWKICCFLINFINEPLLDRNKE